MEMVKNYTTCTINFSLFKIKKKKSKMNFVQVKFTREEHYMITQTITIMEDINFVNKKYSRLSLILFTLI